MKSKILQIGYPIEFSPFQSSNTESIFSKSVRRKPPKPLNGSLSLLNPRSRWIFRVIQNTMISEKSEPRVWYCCVCDTANSFGSLDDLNRRCCEHYICDDCKQATWFTAERHQPAEHGEQQTSRLQEHPTSSAAHRFGSQEEPETCGAKTQQQNSASVRDPDIISVSDYTPPYWGCCQCGGANFDFDSDICAHCDHERCRSCWYTRDL